MVKEKQTEIKGDGKDQATVFVYMNGSDLESEDGEATEDLCEMLAANISSQRITALFRMALTMP